VHRSFQSVEFNLKLNKSLVMIEIGINNQSTKRAYLGSIILFVFLMARYKFINKQKMEF
jgi:hypothetical protein